MVTSKKSVWGKIEIFGKGRLTNLLSLTLEEFTIVCEEDSAKM